MRADARRNVDAVVAAAKEAFAHTGVDTPAKSITDAAGVGVGTLYRHFPRRSDLIIAVLQQEIDECVAAVDQLLTTKDPWTALTAWIERYTDLVATKQGLAAALHSGDAAYDGLPAHFMAALEPALQRLLDRAVAARVVRDDVTARDVITTVALVSQPVPGRPAEFNARMVHVFLEGMRRA
ncbi:TetR/AcrR family transcriptional regulator [Nocardioides sp. C4-1]|uniref:TetR/AcrR family transcriptional regulator n=1 Tax=Nocardioides sp. C4-1 TaxID=3151851 RepID=UPI003266796E